MTHRIHGGIGAQATPMSDGTRPLIAGRYEIVAERERPGGFAGYQVRHVLLDSHLLLTALPAEVACDAEGLARVGAVVRAAGRLRHDRIVPVLDLVEENGRYFIVEPLTDGMPLERVIATEPLEIPEALEVARQLADALAYAHAAGVFHGSVCPANILIEAGSPPRMSLSGFALSALAGPRSPIPAPFLPYTAPERLAGQSADERADVFAVGQVLFELFEQRPLLRGSRDEIEAVLRDGTALLLPRFSRVVPAGLAGLVARAIRRSADERERAMTHVGADLDACLRGVGQRPVAAPDMPGLPALVAARGERPEESGPVGLVPPNAPPAPASLVERQRRATGRARMGSARRSMWRVQARREAIFPPRILVRVRTPRRTSLRDKLLLAGATIAIGWVLAPSAPPPARCPVAPAVAPEPGMARGDASAANAPAGFATTADRLPIDGGESLQERVGVENHTAAAGKGGAPR